MKNIININSDYNILTLDGGGIRGIMLLHQLVDLEKQLKKPANKIFDLISGTSTGAIIAVLLALGYSSKHILHMYLDNSNKIFNRQFFRFGIFRPKYNDDHFNKLIKKYVGNKMLSDLSCDVIIPSYNATKKTKLIFKSKKAKVNESYNYRLYDVIRSSASAQTLFKPHKIDDDYFIDGGVVINNPSLVSYIDVLGYEYKYNNINVLSYSTGIKEVIINNRTIVGGLLSWARPTIDILLAEQSQITDYHMKQLSFCDNINLNYVRCESYVTKSTGKIDDVRPENIKNMIDDGILSTINNKVLVKMFIKYINI